MTEGSVTRLALASLLVALFSCTSGSAKTESVVPTTPVSAPTSVEVPAGFGVIGGTIFVGQLPQRWPGAFPLPPRSYPRWGVETSQRQWACFETRSASRGAAFFDLPPFLRRSLPPRGWRIFATTTVIGNKGGRVTRLVFIPRNQSQRHWQGVILWSPVFGEVGVGGLPCSFTIEIHPVCGTACESSVAVRE